MNGKVTLLLGLIDLEEEVLLRDNFGVGISSQDFRVDLFLKFNQLKLLLNDAVDASLDFLDSLSIVLVDYLRFESITAFVLILKAGEVSSILVGLLSSKSILVSRVFPESGDSRLADLVYNISRDLSRVSSLGNTSYTTGN